MNQFETIEEIIAAALAALQALAQVVDVKHKAAVSTMTQHAQAMQTTAQRLSAK